MRSNEVQFETLYKIPLKNGIYKTAYFQGRGEKIINMKELFAFEFIGNQEMRRIELNTEEKETYLLKEGDLLFGRRSLIESGSGKCSMVRNLTENITFESSLIRVRLNTNLCNPFFYYYYFKSGIGREKVLSISSGTNVKGIRGSDLKRLMVLYPPRDTQDKIVSTLLVYDDLIENNLKRIRLLEEKAQLLYKDLMQKLLSSKSKQEIFVKDCLEFYVGGGWGQEEYKEGYPELAYVIRGTDIPDTRVGNITGLPLRYHKASNLSPRKLKEGDIVFEVSNGQINNIGRTVIITEKLNSQFDLPAMCASFAKLIRVNNNVSPEFFYLFLNEGQENGLLYQYKSNSANGINNFAFETFIEEVTMTLPTKAEMNLFTEKVKPIFSLISTLGQQNTKLREARDILLPRLMSGEIEV